MPSPHEEQPLRLPIHGTTVAAESLRDRLIAAADSGLEDAIEIDGSDVESIGQAVFQLLVAARSDAEAAGRPFRILNPSNALIDRATRCRLADAIGLEAQIGEAQ